MCNELKITQNKSLVARNFCLDKLENVTLLLLNQDFDSRKLKH